MALRVVHFIIEEEIMLDVAHEEMNNSSCVPGFDCKVFL